MYVWNLHSLSLAWFFLIQNELRTMCAGMLPTSPTFFTGCITYLIASFEIGLYLGENQFFFSEPSEIENSNKSLLK